MKSRTSTPYLLEWNETESIDCVSQSIITNDTAHHFWISCTTSIARGTFVLNDENGNGDGDGNNPNFNSRPMKVQLDTFNHHPFAHPKLKGYGHIGDGDYVNVQTVTKNGSVRVRKELWFGIEDEKNPRVLHGAIGRYDAETLEFIDVHPHPEVTTLPFVTYDERRQMAYSMNWTDNNGSLLGFDIQNMQWMNDIIEVEGYEGSTISVRDRNDNSNGKSPTKIKTIHTDDFPYIQGSDMINDTMYLMGDDYQSMLYEIEITSASTSPPSVKAILKSQTALGLGHEREGISIYHGYRNPYCHILSMNNQWYTWEDNHYSGIACISMPNKNAHDNTNALDTILSFSSSSSIGMSMRMDGMIVGFILGLIVYHIFMIIFDRYRRMNGRGLGGGGDRSTKRRGSGQGKIYTSLSGEQKDEKSM